MGNKSSVVAPTTEAQPVTKEDEGLKDTTFRSILFGKPNVEVVKDSQGKMVLKDQVDKQLFDSYEHYLKIMAQLSRIVYCDSGIIREVLLSPEFGSSDNKSVNNKITEVDKIYSSKRKQASSSPNSVEGRPMVSYIDPASSQTQGSIATYVSSPSDLTFMIMNCAPISSKNSAFTNTDALIAFKGSSTVKNFKHDLYSQFTASELSNMLPPGTTSSSGEIGNVTGSFVSPLLKSWSIISEQIKKQNPTRLFVTGHSLGGAYATLFSFILCEIKSTFPSIKSIHLVTFGCPTLLSDKARNTFNKHLDSRFITLDRVVSGGITSKLSDIIPTIPVGFTHPGFQPLRTETYAETKTGRAYNIENIRKVYQNGGVLGLGSEKNKYEIETKTHMPNKISIPAYTPQGNGFAHAEYFDMTWLGAFRLIGMKNPGFNGNTFVADIYTDGINFKYVPADNSEVVAEEPSDESQTLTAPTGSSRRTFKKRAKKVKKSKTRKNK